jgi:hypothetical protein
MKQNIGGNILKEGFKVETNEIRWLIKNNADCINRKQKNPSLAI